jgi:hypothetical protein
MSPLVTRGASGRALGGAVLSEPRLLLREEGAVEGQIAPPHPALGALQQA